MHACIVKYVHGLDDKCTLKFFQALGISFGIFDQFQKSFYPANHRGRIIKKIGTTS